MADEPTENANDPRADEEGAEPEGMGLVEQTSEVQLGVEDEATPTSLGAEPHFQDVVPVQAVESVPADSGQHATLDILLDVSLLITVELGRRDMNFGEILQLRKGSIIELNKLADEPVEIYVNQSKIAEGEVVVVDDHFGVRVTRIMSSEN